MTGILSQNEVIKRNDSRNSWVSTKLSIGNKEISITSYGPKLTNNGTEIKTMIQETTFFKKKGVAIVTDDTKENEEIIINKGDSITLLKTLDSVSNGNGLSPELEKRLFELTHEKFVQLAEYYLGLYQDQIGAMFSDFRFFPKTKRNKNVDDIYLGSF